eukprot:scaffold882_cov85-Skeletonema_marinoi.AAC.3
MNKKLLVLITMMLAAASSAAKAEDPTSTSLDEELLALEYEDEDRLKGYGGWSTWGTKSPKIGNTYGCPPGNVRLSWNGPCIPGINACPSGTLGQSVNGPSLYGKLLGQGVSLGRYSQIMISSASSTDIALGQPKLPYSPAII